MIDKTAVNGELAPRVASTLVTPPPNTPFAANAYFFIRSRRKARESKDETEA